MKKESQIREEVVAAFEKQVEKLGPIRLTSQQRDLAKFWFVVGYTVGKEAAEEPKT